ncbi:GNAT family N-acetyltransferase [Aquimarina sp. RZ0]|uniref:GNAT family N-acetyltransferase n=1 Tax=Aquimarina sp. RZ0 TaxID=2607730 RepID=UPI0011F17DE9|nr:GNAT family N-acetyltransferase [Aquimarina sp. RZ0]KAA1243442.1 GNAT family N-acetyltransferase [Aquimarina sp. RZ0]
MDVHIRIANVEDVPEISYLGKKTFDQSFGYLFRDRSDLIEYLSSTFSIEKLTSSISKSYNLYWIAHYGDNAIGYAKIQLNSPSEFVKSEHSCKLQKNYILKEYLSRGIGAQLQKRICSEAIANDTDYIWLSVLKSNSKAIQFYEKNDYNIIGEHPFSIGKENFEFWVMGKYLK